jgi:hypothetical protein
MSTARSAVTTIRPTAHALSHISPVFHAVSRAASETAADPMNRLRRSE